MQFTEMRDMLNDHFTKMVENVQHLFEVQVNKDEMVNLYLDSFPKGTNEIYRERRKYDCSCCRGFIKNLGNVVAIKDGKIETIWSFDPGDDVFAPVVKALDEYVRAHVVTDVFLSKEKKIGCHHNFEILEKMSPKQWDHFFVELDDRFVIRNAETKGSKLNEFRSAKEVFQRALDEITMDSIEAVMDLINTNTLYKGAEYKPMVEALRKTKVEYSKLEDDTARNLFAWEKSVKLGNSLSRVRNTAIGTLLVDISEGMDLEQAVKAYEVITAPANYKRSKPIFTQKMLDDAQKTITELGYADALPRRHATLDDITVNDIKFVDRSAASRVKGASDIFGELSGMATGGKAKKFDRVEEISIDDFLEKVVPGAASIEAYVGNNLQSNFVSLIAPVNAGVKSMFKWGNNFTWAYRGNMTDSMKERVKALGGSVDGDVRFSIQWNEDGKDNCDLDAHCKEPDNYEIMFSTAKKPSFSPTRGQLDVDIIHPEGKVAVENITWADKHTMVPGTYRFFVHQFSGSVKNGFRAELEIEGQIYEFDYAQSMRHGEKVQVAEITVDKAHNITVKPLLATTTASKKVWNIDTENFVPVTVICNSPNFWESVETPTGHKHVFFMLKDCINDETPSGIFNEFLVQELYNHRRVMEAIGGRMRVAEAPDQLSGLGFATDKRAELVVRVTGATERLLKIKF